MGNEERDKGDLSNKIDELLNKIDELGKKHEQTNKSLEVIKAFILQEKEENKLDELDEIKLVDVADVALLLHISKRSTRKLFTQKIIPGIKDSTGMIKFNKTDVYNYLTTTLIPEQYGIKGSEQNTFKRDSFEI